ncbi:MAG: hypothetical protein ACFFDI_19865 [Promethearchaeota archaeon]
MTLIALVFLPNNFRDLNGQPLKAEIRKNLVRNARYIRLPLEIISLSVLLLASLIPWAELWFLAGAALFWFVMVDVFNTIRTFDTQMLFNLRYYFLPIFESAVITLIIFSLFRTTQIFEIFQNLGNVAIVIFSLLTIVLIGGIFLAFVGSLYLQVRELSQDEESPANLIKNLEEEIKARERYIADTDHEIARIERIKPEERDNERLALLFQKKTWATMDIGIKESRIKRIEDNSSRNNSLLWFIRIVPPAISAIGIIAINLLNLILAPTLGG